MLSTITLSFIRLELLRVVQACSLESVAVGSDRYSVSYSVPETIPPGRPGSGVSCITNGSGSVSASRHVDDARASARDSIAATAVSEPGSGSFADNQGEEGIESSFERTAAPMHLAEE